MFKKKPVIKTLSPLRSSDRRKTADKIIADLRLETTTEATPSGETTEQAQAEATSARSALRKSLLPDNALSAKFTTTSGPDLKEVAGIVYVGSHGNSREQRVLWVKIDEVLYPTVYTLWHNPRIIPLLHTPSLVVEKLKGGADLMTPGLAGPPFPASARKGALAAVASLENPSVPVAVGTCAIDISSLTTTRGAKGHAVETFHWAGDDLWDWSTSGRAGGAAPDELPTWLEKPEDGIAKATEELAISDEEGDQGGIALSAENKTPSSNPAYNDHVLGEHVADGSTESGEDIELSTQEIDNAFRQAFLYGVYEQRRGHPREPKFGLNFPLHQSLFMSHLVLPYLPAFSTQQAQSLQIKKTSWKNARKYVKALDKEKLLLSKEQKNEASVLDIDFEDSQFTGFKPYGLPKKDSNDIRGGESTAVTEDAHDHSIGQKLKVLTLYRPKDSLAPLFMASNAPKLTWYNSSDIRSAVTAYIESSNLIKAGNKRIVNLDPILSNAVLNEETPIDRELLAKSTIPRDVLIERVVSLCAPFHSILRNEETLESSKSKPRAGLPPKVGILLETRGGNKTVTRVYGLEPFYVPAQPLADELRKVCASSTSVEPFKGGKGLEMMIQGPQKDAVIKALDRRGVPKGWIEINDKTKGKKK